MHSARLSLVSASKILSPVEQVAPIPTAKESYGFISTRKILDVFEEKGWTVDKIQTNQVRKQDREGFQKHLVWLKNDSFPRIEGLSRNNESAPRLCLANSHDTSSALNIFFGLLRVACLNQIAAGNVFRFFRTVHSRNVIRNLQDGIDYMANGMPELVENIRMLQEIKMSQAQRFEYAKRLIDLRLENVKNVVKVEHAQVERVLRDEDRAQDAYTVLNRLQEFCVRGGVPYSYERHIKDDAGEVTERLLVHTVTRKLASVQSQMKINQALMGEIFKVTGAKPVRVSPSEKIELVAA